MLNTTPEIDHSRSLYYYKMHSALINEKLNYSNSNSIIEYVTHMERETRVSDVRNLLILPTRIYNHQYSPLPHSAEPYGILQYVGTR